MTGDAATAAVTAQLSQALRGRPFHVGCGLQCRRINHYGEIYFDCPEHGRVEWHETAYGAEHARTETTP